MKTKWPVDWVPASAENSKGAESHQIIEFGGVKYVLRLITMDLGEKDGEGSAAREA